MNLSMVNDLNVFLVQLRVGHLCMIAEAALAVVEEGKTEEEIGIMIMDMPFVQLLRMIIQGYIFIFENEAKLALGEHYSNEAMLALWESKKEAWIPEKTGLKEPGMKEPG